MVLLLLLQGSYVGFYPARSCAYLKEMLFILCFVDAGLVCIWRGSLEE